MSLWGGRFERGSGGADALFRRFNDSLPFDAALLEHDARASAAWASALVGAGVLTAEERDALRAALADIASEGRADPAAVAGAGDEDVHSYLERRLIERLGDLGKKLHTGRSRNDQVATDLRLYARAACADRIAEIRALQGAIIDRAEANEGAAIPGYTHLQRAQPLLFAHWGLAYVEMLDRDAARLADASRRLNRCPLGSAALAGTAYDVDREAIARELGFDGPTANSLDAVADRDFALEVLAALVTTMLHLSRCAEDLIVYASDEFGLVRMSDDVSTGSSIMPQKRNPDALELIRGKAGRVFAAHASMAMTVKGLPLAYNKDLQEDKEPLFDAMEHVSMCLRVARIVFEGLELNEARARESATLGHANATDLADLLAREGVPFREAHEIVGGVVRLAIERGCRIEELPAEGGWRRSRIGWVHSRARR